MAILEARNLTVSYYGDIDILKDVAVDIRQGQITAIIGPNGAGKSTLLKALYGLLKPRKGTVRFNGSDITGLKVHDFIRNGIAYVPQLRSIFPELTVTENLELGTWIFKKDKAKVARAIEEAYSRFSVLAEKRHIRAGLLSGGQQKILEIARALLTRPSVCLLDEPTATLAPKIARQIYETLLALKAEQITVAIVDQRVKQAFDIADYTYVLELGRNKVQGSRQEFEGRLNEVIKGWLE
jgi:branched-chain amino acid transport system ATP-binding protein